MKKLLILSLIAIVLLSSILSVSAANLVASVNACTGCRGNILTFTVNLSKGTEVKSGSVDIFYDDSVLELVDGYWIVAGATSSNVDLGSNSGSFDLAEATSIGGSVFSARFRIRDDADFATYSVSLDLTLQDADGNDIALTNQSGSVTVVCDHAGGTATCTARAVCEICNQPYGDILPHSYEQKLAIERYLKSPATCTSKAVYYFSCICGAQGEETFEYGGNLPHTFDQQVTEDAYVKHAATCTSTAVYYYSCTCGAKGTETFEYGDVLPHTYNQEVPGEAYLVSEADCLNAAVYYKSCICGAEGTETFEYGNSLGHIGGTATCTKLAVCTRCDEPYGEMLPHTYDQENTDDVYQKSEADCLNAAVYYKSCACGAVGTETFTVGVALGHTGGTATCTEQAICTRCDEPYGEMLPHIYDQEVVDESHKKSAADCLNAAVYYKSCACGANGTETFVDGAPLGHNGGTATCIEQAICTRCNQSYGDTLDHVYDQQVATDVYLKSAANCTTQAVYYYSCICGKQGSETFAYGALADHSYDRAVVGAAYCKSAADCWNAAVYYKSCACGALGSETFAHGDALGHTGGTASCTAKAVCTRCNQSYGDLLEHNYNQENTDVAYRKSAANCDSAAVYYKSCACGAMGSETFTYGFVLGHTGGTATCTQLAVCTRCEQEYGKTLPHTFDQELAKDKYKKCSAGCEVAATYYKSCTCGAAGDETFTVGSALGHIGGSATCAKQAVCTRCNQPYGDTLPHTYDQEIAEESHLRSAADCVHAAVYYKSCTCGSNGDETFSYGAALGHNEVIDAAVEATCTTSGLTEGKHCDRCGEVLLAQQLIATLEHNFDDWTTEKDATCTQSGEEIRNCVDCGQTENRQTGTGDHNWTDATCTAPKTCINCGKTEGEALEHTYGQWTNGEDSGEQERTCSCCGRIETVVRCALCDREGVRIAAFSLCWLCFLLLLLIVAAILVVGFVLVFVKYKKKTQVLDMDSN